MRLGSTLRVASTVRPEAFSIVCTIDVASSSESSYDGRELDGKSVLRLRDERVELGADLRNLARAALLRDEPDEVANELVAAFRQLAEDVGLAGRVDLRVAQERAQLGHLVHRACERGEIGCDRVDAVGVLRRLEERARVHAVRDCH